MSRLALVALFVAGLAVPVAAQSSSALLGTLPAAGPAVADSAHRLFAPLRGDWAVTVVDHLADGTRHTGAGEWHFDWVLEGRAMQDVWISPNPSADLQATGVTLRRLERFWIRAADLVQRPAPQLTPAFSANQPGTATPRVAGISAR